MKAFASLNLFALPVVLMAMSAVPALAEGRVFQWTDRAGVVHYSDIAEGQTKPIEVKPTSRGVNVGVASSASDSEACKRKREELQRYSGASKVTETNALGETREYDEAQMKKLVETTEAAVRTACGES